VHGLPTAYHRAHIYTGQRELLLAPTIPWITLHWRHHSVLVVEATCRASAPPYTCSAEHARFGEALVAGDDHAAAFAAAGDELEHDAGSALSSGR